MKKFKSKKDCALFVVGIALGLLSLTFCIVMAFFAESEIMHFKYELLYYMTAIPCASIFLFFKTRSILRKKTEKSEKNNILSED